MSELQHQNALVADAEYGFFDKTVVSQRIFNPHLFRNAEGHTMLRAINDELRRSESFKFSVAFINSSGLGILKQHLLDFKGQGVIYTSTYLDFNEPSVFEELLKFKNIEVRVLNDSIDAFHSKGYIFKQHETTTAIIGSSNLTRGALTKNEEWNLRFSAMPDGHIVEQLDAAIDRLEDVSEKLTPEWIERYEARRKPQVIRTAFDVQTDPVIPVGGIKPNAMQREALQELKTVWDAGEERALIISATGTGKTILGALAVKQARPEKVLFIVHREQILRKAKEEFQKVFEEPDENFGFFVGTQKEIDRQFVFATVQTLSQEKNLFELAPDLFDFIIIDEAHRAGSPSYRKIIAHFHPKHLLGLTATPERSDSVNVYEIFRHNVAYEIRLQKALEAEMLVPFSYYGVSDYIDENGQTIDETANLARLVVDARVDYIVKMLEEYGHPRNVKGLMFCGSKKEAKELSKVLKQREVNGQKLRTETLDGDDSQETRDSAVKRLQNGELDYILTVDIFNEGIDIPSVNQVVMLRNTQSSIIFTQQLGRGLRKFAGKDHLRVIDFIGNYKNNFLIPIALFGDNSSNKDSIRRKMINAQQSGSIAGVSSVSFDAVAQERVFKALAAAKLDSMARLKESYREMSIRVGRVPTRYDFAHFDTVDPTIFLSAKKGSYWGFLNYMEVAEEQLTVEEESYLMFIDKEFLNGKRPHELLILRELLATGRVSNERAQEIFEAYGANSSQLVMESVAHCLDLSYYNNADTKGYEDKVLATYRNGIFTIDSDFDAVYSANSYFASQVDDAIKAGLYINEHQYTRTGELIVEKNYTRRDVGRLLNWAKYPGHQNVGGYFRDKPSGTCPIFINYHKSEDIEASVNYEDHLEDESTLFWYTKNKRYLHSDVESGIINGDYRLDIFVRKSDKDTFVYLGRAKKPRDATQTTMPTDKGELPVVSMRLDFVQPLKPVLVDYLTTKYEDVPTS